MLILIYDNTETECNMLKILCKLTEIQLYEAHLLRLDSASRRKRFQCATNNIGIKNYIEKVIPDPNQVILAKFSNNGNSIIGAAHIGIQNTLAELAFSVDLEHRNKGYGKLLFGKCLEIAKDMNCTAIHTECFSENLEMRALARKFGMKISLDGPDSYADAVLLECLLNTFNI